MRTVRETTERQRPETKNIERYEGEGVYTEYRER